MPSLPKATRTHFSRKGRFLFSILAYFPDVQAKIEGTKAHVSGQGCNVDVPLP